MENDKPVFSVKVTQGDIEDPVQQMKSAIKQIKELLPYHFEMQALIAQLTKSKYDVLVKEGFSKEEALFLISKGGLFQF